MKIVLHALAASTIIFQCLSLPSVLQASTEAPHGQSDAEVIPKTPKLVVQSATLSKPEVWNDQVVRHLVLEVLNAGTGIYPNGVNPIAVLINKVRFSANVYAKIEESGRHFKWVHIPPGEKGAVVIDIPSDRVEWKQCDKLTIHLDPEGYALGKAASKPTSLRLKMSEFASGCEHLPN